MFIDFIFGFFSYFDDNIFSLAKLSYKCTVYIHRLQSDDFTNNNVIRFIEITIFGDARAVNACPADAICLCRSLSTLHYEYD